MSHLYSDKFYGRISTGSSDSAAVVLPLVFDRFRPGSMVDVGCGAGAWLAVARTLGVEDILGIDGDWVGTDQMQVPVDSFRRADLACEDVDLGRRFDLCISLEVAEHLPPERSASFVKLLCRLSDVVMFSAAMPKQGGMGHVCERWPSFWAGLFAQNGYGAVDLVRPRVWDDNRVEPWYRQNTIVYVAGEPSSATMLDVAHPYFIERGLAQEHRATLSGVFGAGRRKARSMVGRLKSR